LTKEFDGNCALHRSQVAVTHKTREGAASFYPRSPPCNDPPEVSEKPTPLRGR
jgi:hypothetical protein